MIPIALYGDRSYNSDTIRKYMISGNNIIPGSSTIHFDEISKERIFHSIDKIRGIRAIIRENYMMLKNRLGRIPYLLDFYENGEIDPLVLIREYKTYQDFLCIVEPQIYKGVISEQEKINSMKTIKVVAAVIKAVNKNGEDIIFATQRGYGEFKDGWEFPGGKIEEGETPQEALKREIMEELDTEISVGELIDTIEYDYPTFHLSMDCFWCEVIKGNLVLKEAEDAKWLKKNELDKVDWLPADVELIGKIGMGQ